MILTLMFSQLFGILGIHKYREEYLGILPPFVSNFIEVFRVSMGDYPSAEIAIELQAAGNYAFWVVFLVILILNNIIFLNFVIAEASNSYTIVAEKLE